MTDFLVTNAPSLSVAERRTSFSAVLNPGDTTIGRINQAMAVQSPPAGGAVDKLQQFLTRSVPTGRQIRLTAVFTFELL